MQYFLVEGLSPSNEELKTDPILIWLQYWFRKTYAITTTISLYNKVSFDYDMNEMIDGLVKIEEAIKKDIETECFDIQGNDA